MAMICDHKIYEDLVINWNMCEWTRDCIGGFAGPQVRSFTRVEICQPSNPAYPGSPLGGFRMPTP